MSIVYGYDTVPKNDPYVDYCEKGTKVISKAADSKRAALLGIFPFRMCHHIICPLTEFFSSLETTYMDARIIQSGSGRGKMLCNWVSQNSFWDGNRTNGGYLLLSFNWAAF